MLQEFRVSRDNFTCRPEANHQPWTPVPGIKPRPPALEAALPITVVCDKKRRD